jgi:hypothetical protein
MEERPVDYFSYLLRMWRTGENSAWRASLEDPQTGERVGFRSLEALWSFLWERTASTTIQEDEYDAKPQERVSNDTTSLSR